MNPVKNFSSFSFPKNISTLSMGKVGILLGSLAFGQWLLSDVAHIPGGGMGILGITAGLWWFLKSEKVTFNAPTTIQGWISRCYEVLEQFELLEDKNDSLINRRARVNSLEEILDRSDSQRISFASTKDVELPPQQEVTEALSISEPLDISYQSVLPTRDHSWCLPETLVMQDALIYVLPLPLRAADMLWLEKIPENQPAWLMVASDESSCADQLKDLQAQLPQRWSSRVLRWDGSPADMSLVLNPVRRLLAQSKTNMDATKQRLLARLHSSWQSDLETLRRDKFKNIQNRSQWIVAGAVFTSPIPSADLLSVAVVNGLMIKEMSNIWSCKMSPELLNTVARKLASAAVAQGVVEWSGQAILGFAKLHGGSWLAAGSMQALSAAYLTRVVGSSMADWMAINNGVSELDLELLDQQASRLVAAAAKKERVDWIGFLSQGKSWIEDQVKEANLNKKILEA